MKTSYLFLTAVLIVVSICTKNVAEADIDGMSDIKEFAKHVCSVLNNKADDFNSLINFDLAERYTWKCVQFNESDSEEKCEESSEDEETSKELIQAMKEGPSIVGDTEKCESFKAETISCEAALEMMCNQTYSKEEETEIIKNAGLKQCGIISIHFENNEVSETEIIERGDYTAVVGGSGDDFRILSIGDISGYVFHSAEETYGAETEYFGASPDVYCDPENYNSFKSDIKTYELAAKILYSEEDFENMTLDEAASNLMKNARHAVLDVRKEDIGECKVIAEETDCMNLDIFMIPGIEQDKIKRALDFVGINSCGKVTTTYYLKDDGEQNTTQMFVFYAKSADGWFVLDRTVGISFKNK